MNPTEASKLAAPTRKNLHDVASAFGINVQAQCSRGQDLVGPEMGTAEIINHLLFMCDEIEKMEDGEKAGRWMGFIQGTMWMAGWRSITELRDETREVLHG